MDKVNKELMNLMQDFFPLSKQPYKEIGEKLDMKEAEVISRIENLKEKGFIRKVGAIINSKRLGFVSLLAAVSVPEHDIERAAKIINSYEGVTHNYLREGDPNIWFTLIEPTRKLLKAHLNEIEQKLETKVIKLPAKKIYGIGVKFDIK